MKLLFFTARLQTCWIYDDVLNDVLNIPYNLHNTMFSNWLCKKCLWSCMKTNWKAYLLFWRLKPKWISSLFSEFLDDQCGRKKNTGFKYRMILYKFQLSIHYVWIWENYLVSLHLISSLLNGNKFFWPMSVLGLEIK